MNSSGFLWIFACFDWCLMLETAAHTLGALPYVLFLDCPLMHFFIEGMVMADRVVGKQNLR